MSNLKRDLLAIDRELRALEQVAGYASPKYASLDDARPRFNSGYHDAANDERRGHPRLLTFRGAQDMLHVSRAFDAAYHEGYLRGLEDARAGKDTASSAAAWKACLREGCLTRTELRSPAAYKRARRR